MKLFQVDTVEDVKKKVNQYFGEMQLSLEETFIVEALDRIAGEAVYAPFDLPAFHRSTVDGYAVQSRDTFGAGESLPTFLSIVGKVEMGEKTQIKLRPGQSAYVPTGGMIPEGADAVVMIEHVENLDEDTIAIYQSVAPGEGMIHKGEDAQRGQCILHRGRKIKPQDIGALVALGVEKIKVLEKPKVAIISTGDEIVDPFSDVAFGQIRDINTYTLSAMTSQGGAEVVMIQRIRDDFQSLRSATEKALKQGHIVILSGGSSVGVKDVTEKVIDSFGEPGVFVQGVAMKPGKPTIIGKAEGKAMFGLPGHPVSAMISFKVFVEYLFRQMLGVDQREGLEVQAQMAINVHASPGKETYQMVVLEEGENGYMAKPVHGKSGAITLLTKSQGYIKIGTNQEGIGKGEKVSVTLL